MNYNIFLKIHRFTCQNNHELCQRCKPYYFTCPTCRTVLTEVSSTNNNYVNPGGYPAMPSAPNYNDFYSNERQMPWPMPAPLAPSMPMPAPMVPSMPMPRPMPTEDQVIYPCPYASYGCWVKFPEHLREVHVSR